MKHKTRLTLTNAIELSTQVKINKVIPISFVNARRVAATSLNELYIIENNKMILLTNFIPIPIKEIIIDDGITTYKKYLFKGYVNGHCPLEVISVTDDDFKNETWITKKWGVQCKIFAVDKCYELIKEYISDSVINIPTTVQFNHIGWRNINGKMLYLTARHAIGSHDTTLHGHKSYDLEVDYSLRENEVFFKTLDMLNITDIKISLPLLLYSILSTLNQPFKEVKQEPKFILWLYGITGCRKTSVAKVFCNHFNRTSDIIPASFKDTSSSIEMKAFEYKDTVLLLDDFHPTSNSFEKKVMADKAYHALRIYGDKISRGRMTKHMTKLPDYVPRGLCLVTGEDIVNINSSVARCIGIEIDQSEVCLEKLSEHQNMPKVFSTFLYYFLQYVSNNYYFIIEKIKSSFSYYRNKYKQEFAHGRFVDALACIIITLNIFIDYGNTLNVYNNETINYLSEYGANIIVSSFKNHNNKFFKETPGIMYIIALNELINSGKLVVSTNKSDVLNNSNCIGYIENGNYHIMPDLTYNKVYEFWGNNNYSFSASKDNIHKDLDSLGLIKVQIEGGKKVRTIKCTIYDKDKKALRPRMLILNTDVMNNILSEYQSETI